MFNLNDRVRFFRGSLPEYQVSLEGIEGLVCSTRPDAPAGWITIWIDWDLSPYDPASRSLPVWINVPPGEVKPVEDSAAPPTMELLQTEVPRTTEPQGEPSQPEPPDEEWPKLRLL